MWPDLLEKLLDIQRRGKQFLPAKQIMVICVCT
jgi:hypothetical protein